MLPFSPPLPASAAASPTGHLSWYVRLPVVLISVLGIASVALFGYFNYTVLHPGFYETGELAFGPSARTLGVVSAVAALVHVLWQRLILRLVARRRLLWDTVLGMVLWGLLLLVAVGAASFILAALQASVYEMIWGAWVAPAPGAASREMLALVVAYLPPLFAIVFACSLHPAAETGSPVALILARGSSLALSLAILIGPALALLGSYMGQSTT